MVGVSGPLPDLDHLRLLLEQVDERVKYQRDEWDGLDRKATTILATTGVVLGLVVSNAASFVATPPPGQVLFVVALFVLVAALAVAVVALWPREFQVVPEPRPFLDGYASEPTGYTIGRLVQTKAGAFEKNVDAVRWKLYCVRTQMCLVTVARRPSSSARGRHREAH